MLNDFSKGITVIDPFFILSTYKNFTLTKLDNPDYFPPLPDVDVAWFVTVVVKFKDQDWVNCIKSEKSAWKFCYQLLNLVIRAKKAAVQNREESFVYGKRFNNQLISYALTIVLCQLSLRNILKLNKEQQRTCVNHFDCETYTFYVEFVQKLFVPIYLKISSSVTLSG